jgi:glycosyltransferase involved in cell wall biosynthesis
VSGPLVSVLTPTFRHGSLLRRCVESVLAQTYPHWELLVREDGEADPAVLAELAGDERVRYAGQGHRGIWRLAETYNDLLESARGDLVAVLEGDDAWPPDKLERQLELHARHPEMVLSFGRARRIDAAGLELSLWDHESLPLERPFDARGRLLFGCPIAAVTVVARREALEDAGGFRQPPGVPAVDYATWLALAPRGPFYASRHVLGHWRVHAGNASTEHVLALARGGRRLALAQVREERLAREVGRYWDRVEGDVQASLGLAALERRDWAAARAAFSSSLRARVSRIPPAPVPAAKAAAGLVLALLRMPVASRFDRGGDDPLAR